MSLEPYNKCWKYVLCKIKSYMKNYLKLPGPKELGRSDHNALPIREWCDDERVYCWEDYRKEVKQLYPIRYWLNETMPMFINKLIWWKFKHFVEGIRYYLLSHLVPSRRYHMLDLRQPCDKNEIENLDCYRYGWVDVDKKMLYAIFNLLGEYLNKEEPYDLRTDHSEEEINNDPCLRQQAENLDEAKFIWHWWTVDRKIDYKYAGELLTFWSEARQNKDPNVKELWEKLQENDKYLEDKEEEMIARLMKIRKGLWT